MLWCFVIAGTRWCVMVSGTLTYPSASSDSILFTWPSAITWPSSSGFNHNYMMAGTLTYPSASDDGVLFTWPSLLTWPTVSSVSVMWWMVNLRDLQSVMLVLYNGWYTYTTFSQWWWLMAPYKAKHKSTEVLFSPWWRLTPGHFRSSPVVNIPQTFDSL